MKRKRFAEEQIIGIFRGHELGTKTADRRLVLPRKHIRQPSLWLPSRRSSVVATTSAIFEGTSASRPSICSRLDSIAP
jgi:hypothetical protein